MRKGEKNLKSILELLAGYPGDDAMRERFLSFVRSTPDCCERSHPVGNLTGSAMVVCTASGRVLLTLHRKLGRWLQLGGHADGCPELDQVALTEAREESGLEELTLLDDRPFDLDVHVIPARPGEPEHLHYDVRFLVVADSSQPLRVSHESHDLRWFTLEEARRATDEPSMWRQFSKVEELLARVG